MEYKHYAATEDVRVQFFDLQTIWSKYRTETWLAPGVLEPNMSRKLYRNLMTYKWCSYIRIRHSAYMYRKWAPNMNCYNSIKTFLMFDM